MRSIGLVRMLMGLLGTGAGCAGLRRKPSGEQLIKEGTTRWLDKDRYVYVGRCEALPEEKEPVCQETRTGDSKTIPVKGKPGSFMPWSQSIIISTHCEGGVGGSLAEESARLDAWTAAAVRWAKENPKSAYCVSVEISEDGREQVSTQNLLMPGISMKPVEKEPCVTPYGDEGVMVSMLVDVSAAQFFCR